MRQIIGRFTRRVLFEIPESEPDLSIRDLTQRADLSGADLSGADLSGADLCETRVADGLTIDRSPLQILGLRRPVIIFDHHTKIGCQLRSIQEWRSLSESDVVEIYNDSVDFWRSARDALLLLAETDGRT